MYIGRILVLKFHNEDPNLAKGGEAMYQPNGYQDLESQMMKDPLYLGLTEQERKSILSDEVTNWPEKNYSLPEATRMLTLYAWIPDGLSDASVRYWLRSRNLETYLHITKSGRRRHFSVRSMVRLKLIAYWFYVKRYSMYQIDEIAGGVQARKREWTPDASLDDLANLQVRVDQIAEVIVWALREDARLRHARLQRTWNDLLEILTAKPYSTGISDGGNKQT